MVVESDKTKKINAFGLADLVKQGILSEDEAINLATSREKAKDYNSQGILQALIHSGLMDTLVKMIGAPRQINSYAGQGNLGEYIPKSDVMGFNAKLMGPDAPDSALAYTGKELDPNFRSQSGYVLAHEMAHRLDKNPMLSPILWYNIYGGTAKPGTYAANAPTEHFAEAYAGATSILRSLARMPLVKDEGFKKSLGVIVNAHESNVPGTAAMIGYLLNQDMYSKYPNAPVFKKIIRPIQDAAYVAWQKRVAKADSVAEAKKNR